MKFLNLIFLSFFTLCISCAEESKEFSPSIIPQPGSMTTELEGGEFEFTAQTQWIAPNDPEVAMVMQPLLEAFRSAAGMEYSLVEYSDADSCVEISINKELSRDEYFLNVDSACISIEASAPAGVFYALQSIRQLLPVQIESSQRVSGVEWVVPAVQIHDTPRYDYRGFMLDVSRTFISKESVMRIIDIMGLLKINNLQFHLIDDNGWRLEIKKYPLLTEIGAWRVEREKDYSARLAPNPGEVATVGGFYTQDDIREIVHYAKQRAVNIIPEIEMPAHSMAAIAAYPELACNAEGRFVGVLPGFTGHNGYTPTMCTSKESVYDFLEGVIDEVIELFPSEYIHIGGDEAPTQYWAECKGCQGLMKKHGYENLHDLQAYMLGRVNTYLRSKGKTLVGWDELVDSKLPEGAVVVGWRGDGHAAFKAGEQGHKYIMAPAKTMYFIRYQGPQWFEPRTYFGNNTLLDVYSYEPIVEGVSEKAMKNMIGTQACLWSEFTHDASDFEYLIFPRLYAFAENGWSSSASRNWSDFVYRLDNALLRLDAMGVGYARSMYNLDHKVRPAESGAISVILSSIRPDLEIRYTTAKRDPKLSDALYSGELLFEKDVTIRAATFKNGEQVGQTLILPVAFNKATAKQVKTTDSSGEVELLVNGVRGSDKYSDFEWCGWYGTDGYFEVDLGSVQPVRSITLGSIIDENMATGLPRTIEISVSADGEKFTRIASRRLSDKECFEECIEVRNFVFDRIDTQARYIKVEFENPGKIPVGRTRVGQLTYVYFDEIIIE